MRLVIVSDVATTQLQHLNMHFFSVFLLSAATTAFAASQQEQSKANLERIKEIAQSTKSKDHETSPSNTTAASDQYVTERIVHHSPAHVMLMLQQKHPHVYLEVLKIKEQVMVDQKRHVIGKEALASAQLFKVNRDGTRTTLRSRLFLLTPNHEEQGEYGAAAAGDRDAETDEGEPKLDWFDKFALALHLDHFWPRLLFSLCAGFSIVSLGFLILHFVTVWLGWHNDNVNGGDKGEEYEALLNTGFRGPNVVSVHRYHDKIEKSAKMDDNIL
jgi:hypothetical protein